MEPNKLKKPIMWLITISSKQNLSDRKRDFIAELVSEEARKTRESRSFILHDIVESKRYCKLLIEGTKNAITNLISVIKNNLPYKVYFSRYQ